MPATIETEFKDSGVEALLAAINRRLKDLTPAMRIIGEIGLGSIQRNFESGGRPVKWKPLSPVTVAERRRRNKWPGLILVRRGAGGGLLGAINYRAEPDRVVLSANKAYATTQHFGARKGQFGTVEARVGAHVRRLKSGKSVQVQAHTRRMEVPWGDIPARPFMLIQVEDWQDILVDVGKWALAPKGKA